MLSVKALQLVKSSYFSSGENKRKTKRLTFCCTVAPLARLVVRTKAHIIFIFKLCDHRWMWPFQHDIKGHKGPYKSYFEQKTTKVKFKNANRFYATCFPKAPAGNSNILILCRCSWFSTAIKQKWHKLKHDLYRLDFSFNCPTTNKNIILRHVVYF